MRKTLTLIVILLVSVGCANAVDGSILHERRARAATEFPDGVLLLHATSNFSWTENGFHQEPLFYYFTGLENTVGAILAIDGRTKESWLFLPTTQIFEMGGLTPEVKPGQDAAKRLGI